MWLLKASNWSFYKIDSTMCYTLGHQKSVINDDSFAKWLGWLLWLILFLKILSFVHNFYFHFSLHLFSSLFYGLDKQSFTCSYYLLPKREEWEKKYPCANEHFANWNRAVMYLRMYTNYHQVPTTMFDKMFSSTDF